MKKYILLIGTASVLVLTNGGQGLMAPAPVEKPKEPVTLRGHRYCVQWLAFSPDGKTLASAGRDNDVRLWDVASGKCTATLSGHTFFVWAVAFSPDGKMVASGSDDRTIRVWNIASGRTTATFRARNGGFRTVQFTSDGKGLASENCEIVRVWDLQTQKERSTLQVGYLTLGCLARRPDGKVVAASHKKRSISFWEVESGKSTVSETEGEVGIGCAFSPDCKTFATGNGGLLQLWDVATAKKRADFKVPDEDITSVGFSPDGKTLAVGTRKSRAGPTEPNSVRFVDVPTRKVFATLTGRQTGALMCVQFSPNGKLLASASGDGTIVLWNVPPRPRGDK